jgi:hypothetical protein
MDQLPLAQVEQAEALAALEDLALAVLAGLLDADLLRRPPAIRLLAQRRRDDEQLRRRRSRTPTRRADRARRRRARRPVRKVKKPRTLIASQGAQSGAGERAQSRPPAPSVARARGDTPASRAVPSRPCSATSPNSPRRRGSPPALQPPQPADRPQPGLPDQQGTTPTDSTTLTTPPTRTGRGGELGCPCEHQPSGCTSGERDQPTPSGRRCDRDPTARPARSANDTACTSPDPQKRPERPPDAPSDAPSHTPAAS